MKTNYVPWLNSQQEPKNNIVVLENKEKPIISIMSQKLPKKEPKQH